MYKFAIIGYPIKHSMSMVMHKAAFKSLGLEGEYSVLETKPEDLIPQIKHLKTNGYNGFNVTIPHKIPISLFLSDVDEIVNMIGSVNTVLINEDKTLKGYNTDVCGFMEPLKKYDFKNKKGIILGTGGASRAIVCGMYLLGIRKIDMYTRNIVNATESINNLRLKFSDLEIKLYQNETMSDFSDSALVVNTTPLGMKGYREGATPVEDKIIQTVDSSSIIYDIVYNPLKTELIKQAQRYNKKYIQGLDMLVYQGAKSFEIWTGKYPNTDKMKIAALEELVN